MYNSTKLAQLEQLMRRKQSKKFYANRLGITEQEVDGLLEEIRKKTVVRNEAEAANYIFALEEQVKEVNNERGTMKSTIELDFEPKSDEELAQLHKIDLSKYKISNYWSKVKPNGKFTSSVFATLKRPDDYTAEDFANFLKGYKSSHVPSNIEFKKSDDAVDVEISISDFHLGKRVIGEENNIYHRKDMFLRVLKNLIRKIKGSFEIGHCVFPISNDFFHTDNYQNSTTNGTPQDIISDYSHEYEVGFDILVEAISILKENCKELTVILVQGNHDRTKSFYLAHALEVYFRNEKHIHFDREHSVTKSIVLGETFIGYHHGNCKIDDLPLLFATGKDSIDFGMCKFREVHTGDKHHYMAKEIKGVRIQQMPSLSGTDRWHLDNNYVNNIRAALALVYDYNHGKIAEFEERI